MLELFSRVPDGLSFVPPGHLTPIPIDEQISSLSAILLNDDYYQFVLAGRKSKHGMPSWGRSQGHGPECQARVGLVI